MQNTTFDLYQPRRSLIHQLDPRIKLVFTVLFILSNVLLLDGAWMAFLLAWGLVALATTQAGISFSFVLKRSLIALPFALAAITIIFTMPGPALATFNLGERLIRVSAPGLIRFISIVLRSWLSVQAAILLIATTQFPDLMHAMRHLRLPASLVAVISFTYRYLFVLAEEVYRLLRARQARSASLPGRKAGRSVVWRARMAGNMVGQLFLRSYERSDRVYNAMLARGYKGYLQTLNPHVMHAEDWGVAVVGLVALAVIQIVGRIG